MKTKIQRIEELVSEMTTLEIDTDYDHEIVHKRADRKLVVALQILAAGTKQKTAITMLIARYEELTKWYA